MRYNKILKPANESIVKKPIFGFDIETRGDKNIFVMGSIVGADNFKKVFWDKKEMENYILTSKKLKGSLLFATNLGFDFAGIFDNVKDYKKFNIILRGSDFISVEYKNKSGHKLIKLDTMNFLKVGLSTLGDIMGVRKLDKPSFLGEDIELNNIQKQVLEEYNIRDSTVTYLFSEFLQKTFNELGTNIKYTVASTSMNLFRNVYLKDSYGQPPKDIIKEMFKGYYGGRTEAFYRGSFNTETLNYYDINSLYPFVMKKYQYPNPNTLNIINSSDLKYIMNYEGLSLCKIETPKDLDIPLLPIRHKDKLVFALGKFIGYYSHCELRKAIELGYKVEPIKSFYYTETINIFENFVSDLYAKRQELKGTPKEIIVKTCLNSLYGKFAQRLEYSEIVSPENIDIEEIHQYNIQCIEKGKPMRFKIDCPIADYEETEEGHILEYPKLYYITDTDSENYPKFINPIFSIYTTSYARLELYKIFEEIKAKDGNVFYCDTDSVFTDVKLNTSKELGDLKLEIQATEGIIVKPKFYYLNNDFDNILLGLLGSKNLEFVKSKGLSNLKTYTQFDKIIETKKYNYTKFTKFKEAIRRNLAFNQKIDIEKCLNFEDNKRDWDNKEFNKYEFQKSKPLIIINYYNIDIILLDLLNAFNIFREELEEKIENVLKVHL